MTAIIVFVTALLVSLVIAFFILRWLFRQIRRTWLRLLHNAKESQKELRLKAKQRREHREKLKAEKGTNNKTRYGCFAIIVIFVAGIVFTFFILVTIASMLGLDFGVAVFGVPEGVLNR